MEEKWRGYGDACIGCTIIDDYQMLLKCMQAVRFTRLQIKLAREALSIDDPVERQLKMDEAALREIEQNEVAGILGCIPAGYKM